MDYFQQITPTTPGVAETFLVLGGIYFVAMTAGAFLFRLPPPGWAPPGWTPPAHVAALITRTNYVLPNAALATPAFYLLWAVLFLNVTAGIGILEQAAPMIQEVFHGRVKAVAAAGFVGLLSLFNLVGRFGWSSASDRLGRKATYAIFFALGSALFVALPFTWRAGSVPLFVAGSAVIISMYGGGFAAIPAYLSDIFGARYVGAIHGRLLTAWSAAGVAGPLLVNYLREYQIDHGVAKADAYNLTMFLMAGLLAVGLRLQPARPAGFRGMLPSARPSRTLSRARPRREGALLTARRTSHGVANPNFLAGGGADVKPTSWLVLVIAWTLTTAPLIWGVCMTALNAVNLFTTP